MRMTVQATELVGTDVGIVSIVKRGANRIPFRITKEDNPMLDLHKIGRSIFKKSEPKPQVIAVMLAKSDSLNGVAAALLAAGIDVSAFEKSDQDGGSVLTKADADQTDAMVMKVNDDVGLLVTGMKKGFDAYCEGGFTQFSDSLAQSGYIPSLYMASDALGATVMNILSESGDPGAAAEGIAKAVDEFKSYVVGITSAIPVQAFKADQELRKAAGDKKPEEAAAEEKDKAEKTAKEETGEDQAKVEKTEQKPEGDEAKKNDGDADIGQPDKGEKLPEEQSGAGAQHADPANVDSAAATKSELSEILKAVEGLKSTFEDRLGAISKDVAGLGERVDGVAAQARKTEEALSGTVFNTTKGDGEGQAKKSEPSLPPLLDTAYERRNAA